METLSKDLAAKIISVKLATNHTLFQVVTYVNLRLG